jgi:protoporphyrinogen oxidase
MTRVNDSTQVVAVLGAGPAGLSCAEMLVRKGVKVVVIDKNSIVGGLARTEEFEGHLFDVGPHRFFTKNDEVEKFWKHYAGDDLIAVKRLTRILYKNKFLQYPLQPLEALRAIGLWSGLHALWSYLLAKWKWRGRSPSNFEEWVISKFGYDLYAAFFKTYTEKVWGIPCHEIGVEWAEQRIKGLSLTEVFLHAFRFRAKAKAKSLIDEFMYTKRGAGLVYENIATSIRNAGSEVLLGSRITSIETKDNLVTAVHYNDANGFKKSLSVSHVFTSIPLTEFILCLNPAAPATCVSAAKNLYYRDHITVNLILPKTREFPDQWIYVHSPEVKTARISNYRNFSPTMATDKTSAISVEYFCFKQDELWSKQDPELIELALSELLKTGVICNRQCFGGYVIREADSYPAYYIGHKPFFNTIRKYLSGLENVDAIGRGGMYKYNNQDHSILSGIFAARRFFGEDVNLWDINTEQTYLEEKQIASVTK